MKFVSSYCLGYKTHFCCANSLVILWRWQCATINLAKSIDGLFRILYLVLPRGFSVHIYFGSFSLIYGLREKIRHLSLQSRSLCFRKKKNISHKTIHVYSQCRVDRVRIKITSGEPYTTYNNEHVRNGLLVDRLTYSGVTLSCI